MNKRIPNAFALGGGRAAAFCVELGRFHDIGYECA